MTLSVTRLSRVKQGFLKEVRLLYTLHSMFGKCSVFEGQEVQPVFRGKLGFISGSDQTGFLPTGSPLSEYFGGQRGYL